LTLTEHNIIDDFRFLLNRPIFRQLLQVKQSSEKVNYLRDEAD